MNNCLTNIPNFKHQVFSNSPITLLCKMGLKNPSRIILSPVLIIKILRLLLKFSECRSFYHHVDITCGFPGDSVSETQVQFLGWKGALEKRMATHSSILVWRIPWTEKPGGLQFMGSQRAEHNWGIHTATRHHLDLVCVAGWKGGGHSENPSTRYSKVRSNKQTSGNQIL